MSALADANGLYRTTNLYEAAYLLTRSFRLAGKAWAGARMAVCFAPDERLEQAVMDYYAGGMVRARELAAQYRSVKDYVFSDKREQEGVPHGIPDPRRGAEGLHR
ncbi:MAG: hypothetical protein HY600_05530 [Candidatus Omnitrophica bacterium]|nr:hypothetical protein [Candidatus Omnitrophota bacterium]